MADQKKDPAGPKESLDLIWVKHNHDDPLYVELTGLKFHVKQKSNISGYVLVDGCGATYFIRNSSKEQIWTKIDRPQDPKLKF